MECVRLFTLSNAFDLRGFLFSFLQMASNPDQKVQNMGKQECCKVNSGLTPL